MSSGSEGAMVRVGGFGDKTVVDVRLEQGAWRELHVSYIDWDQVEVEERCAIFKDKRCGHVRKLHLGDFDVHVANALTQLANLEELTIQMCSICYASTRDFDPPPGIWSQLRRLTVATTTDFYDFTALDDMLLVQRVLSVAPNLRELHITCAHGLTGLADILDDLPMLETLHLDYGNAGVVNFARLDEITPPMLLSVRLHKLAGSDKDKSATASTAKLRAALVRMQHRAPHRFAVELGGKRF